MTAKMEEWKVKFLQVRSTGQQALGPAGNRFFLSDYIYNNYYWSNIIERRGNNLDSQLNCAATSPREGQQDLGEGTGP